MKSNLKERKKHKKKQNKEGTWQKKNISAPALATVQARQKVQSGRCFKLLLASAFPAATTFSSSCSLKAYICWGKITGHIFFTNDTITINPQNSLSNSVFHFCCKLPLIGPVGVWTMNISMKSLIKINLHGQKCVKIVVKSRQTVVYAVLLQQGNPPCMNDISCEQPSWSCLSCSCLPVVFLLWPLCSCVDAILKWLSFI